MWGKRAGNGSSIEQRSPANGSLIQRTQLLDGAEIEALLRPCGDGFAISPAEMADFCARLHQALQERLSLLWEAKQLETGFVKSDCDELLEGILAYARDFPGTLSGAKAEDAPVFYSAEGQKRRIRQLRAPWGTVAVILPQSSALILGITCLLNALAAGNRVILRMPAQRQRSAALFADAVAQARPPHDAVSIVLTRTQDFMKALYVAPAPVLVHYLGSSRYIPSLLSESFEHSKAMLCDGEGNVWVWIGADADPDQAAAILTQGALRYNGQTCTSINGALIHPALYAEVRQRLLTRWNALRCGDPLEGDPDVGPLMDLQQAQWCLRRIKESQGTILCGGNHRENLFFPTLVENPDWSSELVTQGLFGAALWLRSATAHEFAERWQSNRFSLCAGVISPEAAPSWWLTRLSHLARLSLNGDPSSEYLFQPWGGYPASGSNPVSTWLEKYQRVVGVDERL